jgi:D-glycero-D-manno-heptose 1,7-bisphosphate phosphatase
MGSAIRRAAFLDRDGVINVDKGYTHRPEDLVFMPGAIEAVRRLNAGRRLAVVVTNQAGVARGLYEEADVEVFHQAMQAALAAQGAHIDAFYVCPFHPDAVVERYRHPDHPDRKPNPGMILRALADLGVAPGDAFLIGDRKSDLEAARRAAVRGYRFSGGDLDACLVEVLEAEARRAISRD